MISGGGRELEVVEAESWKWWRQRELETQAREQRRDRTELA